MVLGYSPSDSQSITNRLNCRLGSFPTTYLGIPISDSHLSVADLRPSVLKLQHCIKPWKGRWLSKAARTILINSSLSSLLLFIMSFYSLPETLHHEIGSVQAHFYWVGDNPQVLGIATVFEGRVFNPNLLIWHKGTKEYFQVLVDEWSIQPHLKDLISAAKYLVAN